MQFTLFEYYLHFPEKKKKINKGMVNERERCFLKKLMKSMLYGSIDEKDVHSQI